MLSTSVVKLQIFAIGKLLSRGLDRQILFTDAYIELTPDFISISLDMYAVRKGPGSY